MIRECRNGFCIYEKHGACTLEEISVTSAGMCADMIFVRLDGGYLACRKSEILKEFEAAFEINLKTDVLKPVFMETIRNKKTNKEVKNEKTY